MKNTKKRTETLLKIINYIEIFEENIYKNKEMISKKPYRYNIEFEIFGYKIKLIQNCFSNENKISLYSYIYIDNNLSKIEDLIYIKEEINIIIKKRKMNEIKKERNKNKMKTIQYMGSKKNLVYFIEESLDNYIEENRLENLKIFFDAFSGSGRVAYHFRDKYNLITNDKQVFSKIINEAYLNNDIEDEIIDKYIEKLNSLDISYFEKTDKWFSKKYSTDYNNGISIGKDGNPKIWITNNAKKIDMIRTKIDDKNFLKDTKRDNKIKTVLLLSLILAVNKISNVIGHQNGYLKKWNSNSLKSLKLENPKTFRNYDEEAINYFGDIYNILHKVKADITYFDPPYGTNNENLSVSTRYSSFYHLWNTLLINDRPILFGKAGKPLRIKGFTPDLEKNKKDIIIPKFKELIKKSKSKIILFSYSNQGLLSKKEFIELIKDSKGFNIKVYIQSHKINNQSKTALKDGKYINREEENILEEYLFIFQKEIKEEKENYYNENKEEIIKHLKEEKEILKKEQEEINKKFCKYEVYFLEEEKAKLLKEINHQEKEVEKLKNLIKEKKNKLN